MVQQRLRHTLVSALVKWTRRNLEQSPGKYLALPGKTYHLEHKSCFRKCAMASRVLTHIPLSALASDAMIDLLKKGQNKSKKTSLFWSASQCRRFLVCISRQYQSRRGRGLNQRIWLVCIITRRCFNAFSWLVYIRARAVALILRGRA